MRNAVAHIPGFKENADFVLFCDDVGLRWLIDRFSKLSEKAFEIGDGAPFAAFGTLSIDVRVASGDKSSLLPKSSAQFAWTVANEDALSYCEQLMAMLGVGSGHQFLESDFGGRYPRVMVTKGEYDTEKVRRRLSAPSG